MPPRDLTATRSVPLPDRGRAVVSGWGGGPGVDVTLIRPRTIGELRDAVSIGSEAGAVARGMGRSYGDAAQLRAGVVLHLINLRSFELDADLGIVTAQAGATLGQLLDALAPAGWTLPVVPGTQHVTIGGAIASDIHGKNHGVAGTFGAHVLELGLLTAAGDVLNLTPGHGGDLMAATIGGMGLTGVIVSASIKLNRMPSAALSVDTDRVETLDAALSLLDQPGGAYRVAWLDLLGRTPARGVVTRADSLAADRSRKHRATVAARATVPTWWPGAVLSPSAVRTFNELRFHRTPRRQVGQVEAFGRHMFPLDGLAEWPRLYGPSGFVQYQFVVPRGEERTLETVIARLRRSPVPCYLAVLKDFGPANHAPLSFPIAGWTLTLDMPRAAPGLELLLMDFDQLIAQGGGRVYLAKDWRLRPEVLEAMYPRLAQWRAVRDQADPDRRWRSDLGLRTGLIAP